MADDLAFDVVIVGGGPGGVSCALELTENKVSNIILEKRDQLGGQAILLTNSLRRLVPKFHKNGEEFRRELVDVVSRMGLKYKVQQSVTAVDLSNKTIKVGDETYRAKCIVLATGARTRRMSIAVPDHLEADIVYDYNDELFPFDVKSVAVVGGGDWALMDALHIARQIEEVYVVHRSAQFSARPQLQQEVLANPQIQVLFNSEVESVLGENRLTQLNVNVKGNQRQALIVDKVVVRIGSGPKTELVAGQVDMDNRGHVLVNSFSETSVPGVFAVGDITSPGYPTIAAAVGQGAIAAGAIRTYLAAKTSD